MPENADNICPQLLGRLRTSTLVCRRSLCKPSFRLATVEFYKRKQVRRAGPGTEDDYIDSIFISPAEGAFKKWNLPNRIGA